MLPLSWTPFHTHCIMFCSSQPRPLDSSSELYSEALLDQILLHREGFIYFLRRCYIWYGMKHFSWFPLRLPLSPFDLPNVDWRALHTNSSYLSPRTPETIIITLGQKKIYNGFSWLNIWTDMIPWIRTPLTWISWPFRSGQPYWLTSPERWKHEMYSRLSKINLRMTRYLARETE